MGAVTVLIAEDDPAQMEHMIKLVSELRPQWQIVGTYLDITEVPKAIAELSPSLCILDIQFAEKSGIEVMSAYHSDHPVIYVTGESSFAVQAFDASAIDFVVKPIDRHRFEQALAKAERRFVAGGAEQPKPVSIVRMLKGADLTVVPLDSVRYFEADRKFTKVILANQEGYLRMGLSHVELNLNSEQFWRIHRSYVINAKHVMLAKRDELGRLFVRLHDRPEPLPVSRPFENLFRDGFS